MTSVLLESISKAAKMIVVLSLSESVYLWPILQQLFKKLFYTKSYYTETNQLA